MDPRLSWEGPLIRFDSVALLALPRFLSFLSLGPALVWRWAKVTWVSLPKPLPFDLALGRRSRKSIGSYRDGIPGGSAVAAEVPTCGGSSRLLILALPFLFLSASLCITRSLPDTRFGPPLR